MRRRAARQTQQKREYIEALRRAQAAGNAHAVVRDPGQQDGLRRHGARADQARAQSETVADFFFFQAEDGIRDYKVTGVQTCALPISDSTRVCATRSAMRKVRALTTKRCESPTI